MPEQVEQRENEEHVPLQRDAHRNSRRDVEVEEHHEPDEKPRPPVPVGEEDQDQRNQELRRGATDVGHDLRHPRGAQIVDRVEVQPVLEPVERLAPQQRAVAHHDRHHIREVMVELGRRCSPPQRQHDDFERGDLVSERKEEHQQGQPVVFATCGEKDGFVAQTQQCQRDDGRHYQSGIDQTDVTGRGDRPAPPR